MKKTLPARPNLEHLRTQAKTLFNQWNQGDAAAVADFIEHLPAAKKMPATQARNSRFKLADAQSVIARKNGFSSWQALVRHVEQLRQMEGSWEFVDLEVDGRALPAAAFGNSRMLIDGDRFRMESPEADYEGIFTIDVELKPHQIDIEFVEGPEAGNWSYGIFEVEGNSFKICLGLTGASRPNGFATTAGSGHALENLRRGSKTRPNEVRGGKTPAPKSKPAPVDESLFDVEVTPILTKLAGEWVPVELIQNGSALPDSMLSFGSRSMAGNETKVVFGGQVMIHAKVRIDESRSPITVDYFSVSKFNRGQVTLGLMQWIADDVQFCMSAPGQPRPADFSCEAGSMRTLSRWRRRKGN